jgi:aspartyl protease family protein
VLKDRGLKRVGSSFILAAEANVQKKVNEARYLSKQLSDALMRQEAYEQEVRDQKVMIQQLTEQRIFLNGQLAQNLPVLQHNQIVAEFNIVTDRLNLLRGQATDASVKQRIDEDVPQQRAAYIQAVLDLRQLVDQTIARYDELAKDNDVQDALKTLGAKSKSPIKFGPSRDFQDKVKLLAKVEKSVLTEAVDLRRRGGVYEVDVTFNKNETVSMIFDTGASFVTLSADLARRIGLQPKATDTPLELHVADGSVIQARQMTIPSVRVGKFTLTNVACAVMPADKKDAPLLLGQSFINQFTHKVEGGRLILSKVETEPTPSKTATTKRTAKSKRSTKATTAKNAAALRENSDNP